MSEPDKLIQVLGPGCSRCQKVYANAKQAADELGLKVQLEKISDINVMMGFGVMATPALAVDGEVKAAGRIPTVEEIKQWLG